MLSPFPSALWQVVWGSGEGVFIFDAQAKNQVSLALDSLHLFQPCAYVIHTKGCNLRFCLLITLLLSFCALSSARYLFIDLDNFPRESILIHS